MECYRFATDVVSHFTYCCEIIGIMQQYGKTGLVKVKIARIKIAPVAYLFIPLPLILYELHLRFEGLPGEEGQEKD